MATSVHTKIEFFSSFFLSLVKHGIVPMRYHCLYGMHRREEKQQRRPPPSPSSSTHRGQQTLTNTLPMTIIEKKNAKRKKEKNTHTHTHTYKDRRILDHSLSLGIHTPRIR